MRRPRLSRGLGWLGLLLAGSQMAVAALPLGEIYWLSACDLTKMREGQGPAAAPVPAATAAPASAKRTLWLPDQSLRNKPLAIAHVGHQRGVSMYVKGVVWLALDRGSERFMASVGIDDVSQPGFLSLPVDFKIYGDGKLLWESGSMLLGEPARPVDLGVRDVKTLVLIAIASGYGAQFIQADWADARFLISGAPPRTLEPPDDPVAILTPLPGPEPSLNGPVVYGCRPGHPFLYRIPATGERPMRFAADGLPSGLQLDAGTGIIAGTISEPGVYQVGLRAQNRRGRSERRFKIVCGDKLALTPPMGWNAWFEKMDQVTDGIIRQGADIMVSSGMADLGYQYVIVDEGWTEPSPPAGRPRGEHDRLKPNANFPDMKALTEYVHRKGLKAGIYTSPGPATCDGFTGSYGHESEDARQFAEWGFDMLKYDWCSFKEITGLGPHWATYERPEEIEELKAPYRLMGDLLRQQGRDMVFNLCQYGMGRSWEWGAEVGGNYWRTSLDLAGYEYDHIFDHALANAEHRAWSKPGSWNDPDFVQVGYHYDRLRPDTPAPCRIGPTEQYAMMSLWCLSAAPLVFSGDITKLDPLTLSVLCNPEVIGVDQDPLGQCARVFAREGDTFVMIKDLADGSKAVGLCNGSEWETEMAVKWSDLGLPENQAVRDLWRRRDCGTFPHAFSAKVPPHGVFLFQVPGSTKVGSRLPSP